MGLINLPDEDLSKTANHVIYVRAGTACVAVLMILAVLLVNVEESVTWDWQKDKDWYSMPQNIANPFVCQKTSDGRNCSAGWSTGHGAPKCLQLVAIALTFEASEAWCKQDGSGLAVVEDEDQNDDVHRVCGSVQPCWIGLFRKRGSLTFRWVDESDSEFTRWHPSGPVDVDMESDNEVGSGAVLGISAVLAAQQEAQSSKLMGGLLIAIIHVGTMVCAGCMYYNGLESRSTAMLGATSCVDGACACCCCISLANGVFGLVGFVSVGRLFGVALALCQTCMLLLICGATMHMQASINKNSQVSPAQVQVRPPPSPGAIVSAGVRLGGPSRGSGPGDVVIGQPVMGRPVSGLGGGCPAAATAGGFPHAVAVRPQLLAAAQSTPKEVS